MFALLNETGLSNFLNRFLALIGDYLDTIFTNHQKLFMEAHITNFGIENFRVFKNKTQFEFAPITILTGTNSSGKSTLINAMSIFSSIGETKEIPFRDIEHHFENMPLRFNKYELQPSKIDKKFGQFATFTNDKDDSGIVSFSVRTFIDIPEFPSLESMVEVELGYERNIKSGSLMRINIADAITGEKILRIWKNYDLDTTLCVNTNYSYFFEKVKKILQKKTYLS